jgi:hypothetical protein
LLAALSRAATASRFFAALLVTIVSTRFAVAAFQRVFGDSQTAEAAAKAAARPTPPSRPLPPAPSSSVGLVRPGPPRSIQLGISAGPERSEIYVNGRLLGHTPFVGDISCKTGMPLRIELVPPAGPPIVYQRECRGGMLEISGPPP